MIVFNLWGALFVAVALCVGAALAPLSPGEMIEPFTAGIVAILADMALRAHKKSGPWKGTGFGNVAGDLFDPSLGGMVMILPIWFWGLAAIVLGVLHRTGVL